VGQDDLENRTMSVSSAEFRTQCRPAHSLVTTDLFLIQEDAVVECRLATKHRLARHGVFA
jgi:hypothetical protein